MFMSALRFIPGKIAVIHDSLVALSLAVRSSPYAFLATVRVRLVRL